ncbi:sugar phosphate isomerase/epimerase family protein [Seonamhaeicola marinus]|uniref:Sugar phosphate isomerase/epimerase n=1 Tax=Seonamhaeicola marinus TaxID=1912246 RepID=A0A5D0HV40_9FLAO|nr:sugar phosphate isomerase/epimerase family protein [Seonamhaeicola marinus]TYA74781.1 sugar phosphate isomerase/epimerase [Seonamhaeicola marinus]
MKRRDFIYKAGQSGLALSFLGLASCKNSEKKTASEETTSKIITPPWEFKISLAQWSLHKALFAGEMDNLDFAAKARSFGCEGVEYVNGFFKDKAKDMSYLKEMKSRANAEGQQNVLIMIDGEGGLATPDEAKRKKAIENHYKWVEAAHFLGCHAIRVNLAGASDYDEGIKTAIESLGQLSEFAKGSGINVLVENHGGFSSNGTWMHKVFSQVKNDNCGTLPDFGNFCIKKGEKDANGVRPCFDDYDRYKGMKELLPFAKAVSAKSYEFDAEGNETTIDYLRVMEMVKEVGYSGFVGIEYEGHKEPEEKGIELTRDLLIKVRKQLA